MGVLLGPWLSGLHLRPVLDDIVVGVGAAGPFVRLLTGDRPPCLPPMLDRGVGDFGIAAYSILTTALLLRYWMLESKSFSL